MSLLHHWLRFAAVFPEQGAHVEDADADEVLDDTVLVEFVAKDEADVTLVELLWR